MSKYIQTQQIIRYRGNHISYTSNSCKFICCSDTCLWQYPTTLLQIYCLKNHYPFISRAADTGDASCSQVFNSLWGGARFHIATVQASGAQPGQEHWMSRSSTLKWDQDLAPLGSAEQHQYLAQSYIGLNQCYSMAQWDKTVLTGIHPVNIISIWSDHMPA